MPGLRFPVLAQKFVAALELAGATVILASPIDRRPLTMSVVVGEKTYRLEVYLWTITEGGKGRGRPRERRVQRTSMGAAFVLKPGTKTIMGGWSEETDTFAFWDVRRHLTDSASPSSQIDLDTLESARLHGMATQHKQLPEGEEVAIAVQPDYLLWYVENFDDIYEGATEVADAAVLVEDTPEKQREFIDSGPDEGAQSRRHKLVTVVQTFRDARFRPAVLHAYGFRCALTDIALRHRRCGPYRPGLRPDQHRQGEQRHRVGADPPPRLRQRIAWTPARWPNRDQPARRAAVDGAEVARWPASPASHDAARGAPAGDA